MAEKGWTAQVAAAAGVAAGTGAAQLGLGYGLGVVEWPAVATDDSVWLGSLGWATWIAASATVFGAVIAGRLGRVAGGPWRFALAASAAVGALLTVALIALPARSAVRTDTFSPHTIAGGYAVIGILLGLAIAYWAVVSRPVAANLIATAAWLWSLAVAAVVATIFWHRPSATYLSSWQFVSPDTAESQYGVISWPSALLTLLAALVVGAIGVLPAVRRGDRGVGAAASGAVGPLLVAAAFFVLSPQLSGSPGPLQSAYLIAPYAVLAGLAGSALVVGPGQRRSPAASGGSGAAVVPSSRAAAKPQDHPDKPAEPGAVPGPPVASTEPEAVPAAPVTSAEAEAIPALPVTAAEAEAVPAPPLTSVEGRPRRSFMDRIRRGGAARRNAESVNDPTAVATGRAKAPASAMSVAPEQRSSGPSSRGGSPSGPSDRGGSPSGPSDLGGSPSRRGAVSARNKPQAAASSDAPGDRAGAASVRPAGSPRSSAASIDGAARPATSSAPGRSDNVIPAPTAPNVRSTVAPPPASPPVAKINEALSGEKRPPARKSASAAKPSPADADTSDKPSKTPTKSTKATPAPRRTRPAGTRGAAAQETPRWSDEADTAELPVQQPRNGEARPS